MRLRTFVRLSLLSLVLIALRPAGGAAEAYSVLLISLDGFRWDYCDLHPAATPNLRALRDTGASARALIPVFPTHTFPNHYTIVTGLYPARHGVINNHMFDPTDGVFFRYTRPENNRDSRWWGGEPIWVTAAKQGRTSACFFWVGSEAEIKGHRPTLWKPFDATAPFAPRLDELISTLSRTGNDRPAVTMFYLEETNSVAHKFGPDALETIAAIELLDRRIGEIVTRLEQQNLRDQINLIFVSDHGMTATSEAHVVILDDVLDLRRVQVEFDGAVTGLRPLDESIAAREIVAAFKDEPRLRAFLVEDLPARFHYRDNPRIPPVVVIANEGWQLLRRSVYTTLNERGFLRGDHGYDPALPSMHGILIANGPAFKSGVTIDAVENVHLYNLMCAIARLRPAPNDGDDRLIRSLLR